MVDDYSLIKKITNSDMEALEKLFKKYKNDVYRYAFIYAKDEFIAEDIVQDVFLKIVKSAYQYKNDKSVKAWILQITRNTAFDILKHNAFSESIGDEIFNSVIQTMDGGYAAAGFYGENAVVIKVDSNGNKLWLNKYEEQQYNLFNSVVQTSNGDICIAGVTSSIPIDDYNYNIKYQAINIMFDNDGNELWNKNYKSSGAMVFKNIIETKDKSLIMLGEDSSCDHVIYKIDNKGNIIWNKLFTLHDYEDLFRFKYDYIYSVVQLYDERYVVCGSIQDKDGGQSAILYYFDSNGNNKTNVDTNNEIKTPVTQQNSTNMNITNKEQLLISLNVVLPNNWNIDRSKKVEHIIVDEKGEKRGSVYATSYIDSFDFITQMPNHATIIKDEYIDIPLCRCRLITLDTDNGSAASGITGTHDVYYAEIPVKGKAIYMINYTENDKSAETKEQFIEILNKLSLN